MKKYHCVFIVLFLLNISFAYGQQQFTGNFSNGYKGAKLSFTLSADKKSITNFTFSGYWSCSGGIENIVAGPKRSFKVVDGKIDDVISDPEMAGRQHSGIN